MRVVSWGRGKTICTFPRFPRWSSTRACSGTGCCRDLRNFLPHAMGGWMYVLCLTFLPSSCLGLCVCVCVSVPKTGRKRAGADKNTCARWCACGAAPSVNVLFASPPPYPASAGACLFMWRRWCGYCDRGPPCVCGVCVVARARVYFTVLAAATHTHAGGSISSHAGSGGRRWSVMWTGQKHSGRTFPFLETKETTLSSVCVCLCRDDGVCVFALLCVGDAIRLPKAFHGRLCVWRARPWCGVVSCIIMLL